MAYVEAGGSGTSKSILLANFMAIQLYLRSVDLN